jgi:hypothetical protein
MADNGEAQLPVNPDASVAPAQPRRRRTVLELVIIVVGGWIITTVAQGLLNSAFGSLEMLPLAIGGMLTTAWYCLLVYEGYQWFAARPDRPATTTGAASRGDTPRIPTFGIVAIACAIFTWLWVRSVFYSPIQGHGESALIGLAAAGFLCVVMIFVGTLSGIVSLVRKERRWVGRAGLGVNLATAATLFYLLWRLQR